MSLGKRVAKWLEQLHELPSEQRLKAARQLLKTSENYFHESRVTSADRHQVIRSIHSLSSDTETEVRITVAQLIGLVREWCEETEASLGRLLCDAEPDVLVHAVWAAGHIGTPAAPLVSKILSLAAHSNREVRWRVSWALSEIKECNSDVVVALITLSMDYDSTARMYAFDAMAQCHADPATIFPSVNRGLLDTAGEVQGAACRVVAAVPYDWTAVEARLLELFRAGSIYAVMAICHNWPERIRDPEINSWLQANSGYWWAEDFLTADAKAR